MMIQTRKADYIQDGAGGAGLAVPGTIYQSAQTGVYHGSRTHGARLQGTIQGSVIQAPALQISGGLPQSDQLGMSGSILLLFLFVAGLGNDAIANYYHCPDGDIPGFISLAG
jgi:hypothetical protein